jgi:hypothetical protein
MQFDPTNTSSFSQNLVANRSPFDGGLRPDRIDGAQSKSGLSSLRGSKPCEALSNRFNLQR